MEALLRKEKLEFELENENLGVKLENKDSESSIEYIESDTKGKLRKIIEGSIFNGSKVFIKELFQNAYRARAKNVYVTIEDDCISVSDDGCGLKSKKALLTFDYSEWDTTKEGFGIGFWAVLSIPNLEYVKIKSNKFYIYLDVEKVKDTLAVDTLKLKKKHKGFKVNLKSDYIAENKDEIIYDLKECGKYMSFNLYVNEEQVAKENLFNKIYGDYTNIYNTRLFEAKIAVSANNYDYPEIYYENRLVEKLYEFPYTKAVILLKKNSVNLKEPDRETIIYNSKRSNFVEKFQTCVIDLYKNYLNLCENNDDDMLDKYVEALSTYLKPKDYSGFLYADETIKLSQIDKINEVIKNNSEVDTSKVLDILNSTVDGDSEWVSMINIPENLLNIIQFESIAMNNGTDINEMSVTVLKIDNKIFIKKELEPEDIEPDDTTNKNDIDDTEKINTSDFNSNFNNEDIVETVSACNKEDELVKAKKNNKTNIKDLIKKNRYCMWVKSSEVDLYLNHISLAEYNGIKVFKAKNALFEEYFKSVELTHVSDLNNAMFEDFNIFKNNPGTKKEEMFLLLLEPIRKMYELQPNVFRVGNIEHKIQFTLGGKIFQPKVRKNNSKKIETYAVRRGNSIIFDRHAINLKLFNLNIDKDNFSIGKHELKCLMYNLDTIAHELAHLLYGTTDNTKEHTIAEKKIQGEIINYVVKKY